MGCCPGLLRVSYNSLFNTVPFDQEQNYGSSCISLPPSSVTETPKQLSPSFVYDLPPFLWVGRTSSLSIPTILINYNVIWKVYKIVFVLHANTLNDYCKPKWKFAVMYSLKCFTGNLHWWFYMILSPNDCIMSLYRVEDQI